MGMPMYWTGQLIRPGQTIGTTLFGQVTSAGLGRVMQFGLRFEF